MDLVFERTETSLFWDHQYQPRSQALPPLPPLSRQARRGSLGSALHQYGRRDAMCKYPMRVNRMYLFDSFFFLTVCQKIYYPSKIIMCGKFDCFTISIWYQCFFWYRFRETVQAKIELRLNLLKVQPNIPQFIDFVLARCRPLPAISTCHVIITLTRYDVILFDSSGCKKSVSSSRDSSLSPSVSANSNRLLSLKIISLSSVRTGPDKPVTWLFQFNLILISINYSLTAWECIVLKLLTTRLISNLFLEIAGIPLPCALPMIPCHPHSCPIRSVSHRSRAARVFSCAVQASHKVQSLTLGCHYRCLS